MTQHTERRSHGWTNSAAASVRRVTRQVADSGWGDRASRVGLAARGVVFLVLAYLIARIALGAMDAGSPSSKPVDGPGVAEAVADQPGGHVALVVLAVGLLLYAMFSLIDTVLHHNDETPAAKRWGDRALSAWGFVMYAAFSVYCFAMALSAGSSQSSAKADRQKAEWTASVLRWPGGQVLLFLLGVVLIVIALFLVSRAVRRSFLDRLDRDAMSPRMWRLATALGCIGSVGQAGLFGIVGWFVLTAAVQNDPTNGQGVNGSVRMLAHSASGPFVLWALVVALVGFALHLFLEARYRVV